MRKQYAGKKMAAVGLAAVLAMSFAVSVSAEEPEVREIHVATGASVKPWTYFDENNKLVGNDVEIVEAVFDRLPQYELVWDLTDSYGDIFTGIDAGHYQMGANNIDGTEESRQKYLFSTPKTKTDEVLLSSTITFDKERYTFDELGDYTITYEPGVEHTAKLESWNAQNPDKAVAINYTEENLPSILQNVETGKYELFSTDNGIYFGAYKDQLGLDLNYAYLDYGEGQNYTYFIAAIGEEQLMEDFNAVLAELVADGTLAEISEKYIGDDLVPYEAYED